MEGQRLSRFEIHQGIDIAGVVDTSPVRHVPLARYHEKRDLGAGPEFLAEFDDKFEHPFIEFAQRYVDERVFELIVKFG